MNPSRVFFGQSFTVFFFFGVASLLSLRSISQEIDISYNSDLKIDGAYEDWKNIESFSFPSAQGLWQANEDFNEGDLEVGLKIGSNDQGIFLLLNWSDDIFDSKYIPKDSSVLTTSSGRMDKMYLYDNVKIQFRTDSSNHVSWFKPNESALQWSSLRKKSTGSWSNIPIPMPEYNCISNDSKKQLEVLFSWEQIGSTNEELSLLILVNDTDLSNVNESDRLGKHRSYISLSSKIKLR